MIVDEYIKRFTTYDMYKSGDQFTRSELSTRLGVSVRVASEILANMMDRRLVTRTIRNSFYLYSKTTDLDSHPLRRKWVTYHPQFGPNELPSTIDYYPKIR